MMKRKKLAAFVLVLGVLLVYLMFALYQDGRPRLYVFREGSSSSRLDAGPSASEFSSRVNTADDASSDSLPPLTPVHTEDESGGNFLYGIMFDAGSTGTRVHIFKFQVEDNEFPKLVRETFRAIKPGLSSYSTDPDQCVPGIVELLNVAQSSVPPSRWPTTPVVLKATAGLRLLPGLLADRLLDKVRAVFDKSPFLSRDDSVSIMEGTDEGISAWITINFLIGGLQSPNPSTVGMLDLGGGSTQITFSSKDEKTIQTSPIDDIRSFQVFNKTHTLYAHSYLGLGLMSVRLTVLSNLDCPPSETPGGATELVSACVPPHLEGSFEFDNKLYKVKGQKAGEAVYDTCRTKVEKVLYKKVLKSSEAPELDFYAFSYYYDLAAQLGLIDKESGGTVKVSDYTIAAKAVCDSPNENPPESPFLCLDLIYVSVLLQELGFPPEKSFKLARTINGMETSWALGATFHYLETVR